MLANKQTASVGTLGRFVIYKLWVILGTVTA